MKRTEGERHEPQARNTPLPLDAAALDRWSALLARIIDHSDGTRPFAEVYDDELEPFIAQSRAALTLAARVAELEQRERDLMGQLDISEHKGMGFADRVAELERELAEARSGALAQRAVVVCNDLARIDKERMEWQATANALREALEGLTKCVGYAQAKSMYGPLFGSKCLPAIKAADAALAAHPAANAPLSEAQTASFSLAAHDAEVLERARVALNDAEADCECGNISAITTDKVIRALAAQEVKP